MKFKNLIFGLMGDTDGGSGITSELILMIYEML